jgi:hypothetical protein
MNRFRARVALPVVLAVGFLTAACSSVDTFEGGRSDDQVAVIVPENPFNRRRDLGPFRTSSRSGEVRVRVAGESLGGFSHSFRVLPGRHDLAVVYLDDRTPYPERALRTREVTLRLDAVAGHTYGVRGEASYPGGRPTVRIVAVDGADGRVVAAADVPRDRILLVEDPEPLPSGD